MKKLNVVVCLMLLGLLLGCVPQSVTTAAASQAASPQLTSTASADESSSEKTFTGTIGQLDDGRFALQESNSNYVYLLDDQEKAKQFAGKKVKVIGSLDSSASTIKVTDIQAA